MFVGVIDLQGTSLSVIITDPLVIPGNLFNSSLLHQFRRQALLLDNALDLVVGQEAFELGAIPGLARAGEITTKLQTVFLRRGVAAAIVCHADVDFLRI